MKILIEIPDPGEGGPERFRVEALLLNARTGQVLRRLGGPCEHDLATHVLSYVHNAISEPATALSALNARRKLSAHTS